MKSRQYLADVNGLKNYFLENRCIYEENYLNKIENKIIVEKNVLKFSIDMIDGGKLHIACIDNNNKLLYITKNNDEWSKNVISKIYTYYRIKDIKLYTNLNNLTESNILLLVKDTRYRNTYSLFFYYIRNSNWNARKITDLYYDRYAPSFKSDIDCNGNLHILFKTKENNKYKVYYKIYDARHNKWGLSEKITESSQDITNCLLLCDTNNNINIVWSSLLLKNININFIRRNINLYKRTSWKKFKTLPGNISNLTYPILIQVEDSIKFGWKQSNFYNIVKTNLEKDDWKKSSSIKLDSSKLLTSISIVGYKLKNIDIIKAPYTYICTFKNNRKVLGINNISAIENIKKVKVSSSDSMNDNHNINEGLDNKNTPQSIDEFSQPSSLKQLDEIGKSIEESSIVNDMYPNQNLQNKSNDLDSFINRLNSLYKEIEDVKSKELTLLNSILDLRKKNNNIYKKVEEIIGDYNDLDNASTKTKV